MPSHFDYQDVSRELRRLQALGDGKNYTEEDAKNSLMMGGPGGEPTTPEGAPAVAPGAPTPTPTPTPEPPPPDTRSWYERNILRIPAPTWPETVPPAAGTSSEKPDGYEGWTNLQKIQLDKMIVNDARTGVNQGPYDLNDVMDDMEREKPTKEPGADSPLDIRKKELHNEIKETHGETVAINFIAQLEPLFKRVTGSAAQQITWLNSLEVDFANEVYLQRAIAKDTAQRRSDFIELAKTTFLDPLIESTDPQDNVTLGVIDSMIEGWADDYEEEYQDDMALVRQHQMISFKGHFTVIDSTLQPWINPRTFMMDSIKMQGIDLVLQVRPDLSPSDLTLSRTKSILNTSMKNEVKEAKRMDNVQKEYISQRDKLIVKLAAVTDALVQDDTGTRALISDLISRLKYTDDFQTPFLDLNKNTPTGAAEWLQGKILPEIKDIISGTRYDITPITDNLFGTLENVRKVPAQLRTEAEIEAKARSDETRFKLNFEDSMRSESLDTQSFLKGEGITAESLWEQAKGNLGYSTKTSWTLQELSRLAERASQLLTLEVGIARGKSKGKQSEQLNRELLSRQSPEVRAQLGPIDFSDPNFQIKVNEAIDQVKARTKEKGATAYTQNYTSEFMLLPEPIRRRFQTEFGDDPVAAILQANAGDAAAAAIMFNNSSARFEAEIAQSTTLGETFSKEAGFDPTKFSPSIQAKIAGGTPLSQAEIEEMTRTLPFWEPYQSSLEPVAIGDTTGTGMPYQKAAGAKKIAELWKKSGYDPVKYARLLNEDAGVTSGSIETVGDLSPIADIAALQREDLPGGLTPEERANFGFAGVKIPQGASAKSRRRAVEVYHAFQMHPEGSPGRAKARQKWKAEDEEEKRKLEPKPPRGRVL
jgi:hypothetical protein